MIFTNLFSGGLDALGSDALLLSGGIAVVAVVVVAIVAVVLHRKRS